MSNSAADDVEFPDLPDDREHDFTKRLRAAVRAAGKGRAVAERSGVAYGTLNGYLAGQDPKWSNLLAIAKACDVSIDWLATGEGSMRPGGGIATGPAMPLHKDPTTGQAKLFSLINMPLFEAALEGADEALRKAGAPPDNWRARAQLVCLLYDAANADIKNT